MATAATVAGEIFVGPRGPAAAAVAGSVPEAPAVRDPVAAAVPAKVPGVTTVVRAPAAGAAAGRVTVGMIAVVVRRRAVLRSVQRRSDRHPCAWISYPTRGL